MTRWSREQRLRMMREVVGLLAKHGDLLGLKPGHFAATYGVSVAEVEAELMKHMTEGDGI